MPQLSQEKKPYPREASIVTEQILRWFLDWSAAIIETDVIEDKHSHGRGD